MRATPKGTPTPAPIFTPRVLLEVGVEEGSLELVAVGAVVGDAGDVEFEDCRLVGALDRGDCVEAVSDTVAAVASCELFWVEVLVI